MKWAELLCGNSDTTIRAASDRSAFERDYDRVIFSHPFRRLQDKTQVFPLPEQDFVHTRLTHSLEVSSVGRSLGRTVGEDLLKKYRELDELGFSPFDFGAIVSAACLTHDLGNPPFGHTGEDAISDYFRNNQGGRQFQELVTEDEWEDLVNFEGNAQGFRILTGNEHQGLRLTEPTLAAFTKYPRQSRLSNQQANRRSQKKYGYFQTEKDTFQQLATNMGLRELEPGLSWCRHPLAFLVEAADDICYHIIDLEDGCRLGLVSEMETVALFAGILGSRFKPGKLESLPSRDERIGMLRAVAIGILIDQAAKAFLENEKGILSGDFDRALTDLIDSKMIMQEIIQLSLERLYRSQMVLEIEAAGFEILGGLLESFTGAAYSKFYSKESISKKQESVFRLLPATVLKNLSGKTTPYNMLRLIIDFVSGLTDRHAIALYRKLKGISMPGTTGI